MDDSRNLDNKEDTYKHKDNNKHKEITKILQNS